MIGNDIVDLRDPDADPRTFGAGFDRRVFTRAERDAIDAQTSASARERWSRWAAKEAAFKLARKRRVDTVFSPIRFETHLEAPSAGIRRGRVEHGRDCYSVRLYACDGFVHAVVTEARDVGPRPMVGIWRAAEALTPEEQSREVRRLALARLTRELGEAEPALSFEKTGRIPEVHRGGERLPIDVSFSHHGRYVAFACRREQESLQA